MTEHQIYLLSLVLGQALPVLIDAVNKYVPSSRIRFLASVFISVGLGIVFNYNRLDFRNIDAILTTALILWSSSQTAYKMYYGGSKIQNSIRFTKVL